MKVSNLPILLLITSIVSCDDKTPSPELVDLPNFEAAVFTNPTVITNAYYGPAAGKVYVYHAGEVGQSPEEEITIERRTETKTIMGVACIIHHDVVKKDNVLVEDTDDWMAQDDDGNLWYMGEFVKNYEENGDFSDNDGSWEAGVDEALPGYWIPASPVVGQTYFQEYYEGEAEDRAEVLEVGVTVTIGLGTYENCIVTKDINPYEEDVYEKKYYAPGIGAIKEEKFEDDELIEVEELIEIRE